jgi:hypothetical protein
MQDAILFSANPTMVDIDDAERHFEKIMNCIGQYGFQ